MSRIFKINDKVYPLYGPTSIRYKIGTIIDMKDYKCLVQFKDRNMLYEFNDNWISLVKPPPRYLYEI